MGGNRLTSRTLIQSTRLTGWLSGEVYDEASREKKALRSAIPLTHFGSRCVTLGEPDHTPENGSFALLTLAARPSNETSWIVTEERKPGHGERVVSYDDRSRQTPA